MENKMVIGPDFSREAQSGDLNEIDALLNASFGHCKQSEFVHQLRKDGDMWLEIVKPWNGIIAGYAALSRMREPEGWACLAPVAVLPRFQNAAETPNDSQRSNYAIGTRLVSDIASFVNHLQDVPGNGTKVPTTIVVLGKPSFYERAGFNLARAQKLTSPFPVKLTLIARAGEDVPEESLVFPPASDHRFSELFQTI